MDQTAEARYGRMCLLLLNVCPFTLRHVIDGKIKRDSLRSFQDFLEKNKHELYHLMKKYCCCRSQQSKTTPMNNSQWDLLYIKNSSSCSNSGNKGDCPCKYGVKPGITSSDMDITLCCLFIKNLCSGDPVINMTCIEDIRKVRNEVIHASCASLDESTYIDYLKDIKNALSELSKPLASYVHTQTLDRIKQIEDRLMNPGELGGIRKALVDETRVEDLEENVLEIKKKMDERDRDFSLVEQNTKQEMAKLEGRIAVRIDEKFTSTAASSKRKGSDLEETSEREVKKIKLYTHGGGTLTGTLSRAYKHIIVLKKLFFAQLKNKLNKDETLKDLFNSEHTKHLLYGQWKNAFCCICKEPPEVYKMQFISDIGWGSLYQKIREKSTCKLQKHDCACLYDAKQIKEEHVSIATMLSVMNTVGGITRNAKKSLRDIRCYCEAIIRQECTGNKETAEFANEIEKHMQDFSMQCFSVNKLQALKNEFFEANLSEDDLEACIEHKKTDCEDTGTLTENMRVGKETLASFQEKTRSYLNKKTFYVSLPRMESDAKRQLEENHLLIVTGHAGEGKSSLCRRLLQNDDSEFKLKLRPGQENLDYLDETGRTVCLYFEDFLGMSQYVKLYSKDNHKFFKDLTKVTEFDKNNPAGLPNAKARIKIICCVRNCVFDEAKVNKRKEGVSNENKLQYQNKEINILSKFQFDLSAKDHRLNEQEMREVIQQYEHKYRKLDNTRIVEIIDKAKKDDFHGFHECCALYFLSEMSLKVFDNPKKTIEDDIRLLKEQLSDDNFEYLILKYKLFENRPFNVKNLNQALFEKLQAMHGLEGKFSPADVHDCKTYHFLVTSPEGLEFQHQLVREAVLQVISVEDADTFLDLAKNEVIAEYVRPSTYKPTKGEVCIRFDQRLDRELAKTLLEYYNYINIAVNKSSGDKEFVEHHLFVLIKEKIKTDSEKFMKRMQKGAKAEQRDDLTKLLDNFLKVLATPVSIPTSSD